MESEFRSVEKRLQDQILSKWEWHAYVREEPPKSNLEKLAEEIDPMRQPGGQHEPIPSEGVLVIPVNMPLLPDTCIRRFGDPTPCLKIAGGGVCSHKLMKQWTYRYFNALRHGNLRLTEVAGGELLWEMAGYNTRGCIANNMVLLCDGVVATFHYGRRIRTWCLESGESIDNMIVERTSSSLFHRWVLAVVDDQQFVLGYHSGHLLFYQHNKGRDFSRIYSIDLNKTLFLYPSGTHGGFIIKDLSVCGRRLVSAFCDGAVAVWDLEYLEFLAEFPGGSGDQLSSVDTGHAIIAIGLSSAPYVRALRTTDDYNTLRSQVDLDRIHSGPVTSVVVLDHDHILSASMDRTVAVSKVETRGMVARGKIQFLPTAVTVLPDGFLGLIGAMERGGRTGYAIMPPLPGAEILLKSHAKAKYSTGSTGTRWQQLIDEHRRARDWCNLDSETDPVPATFIPRVPRTGGK